MVVVVVIVVVIVVVVVVCHDVLHLCDTGRLDTRETKTSSLVHRPVAGRLSAQSPALQQSACISIVVVVIIVIVIVVVAVVVVCHTVLHLCDTHTLVVTRRNQRNRCSTQLFTCLISKLEALN